MSALRAHLLSDPRRLRRVASVAASVGFAAVMLTACKPGDLASAFPGRGTQPTRTVTASPAPTTTSAVPTTTTSPPTTTTTTTVPTTSTSTSTTPTTTTAPPTTTTRAPAPQACAKPAWESSRADDMWNSGGYIVHNNMWNAGGYNVTQTLTACSYKLWSVTAIADDAKKDGAVKTYPNVHKDYHDWGTGAEPKLSSFKTLQSTFAASGPGTGIYDIAYDIWLNGVPGENEVMIWTENQGQRPSGDIVEKGITFSGVTWDLWASDDNGYIAFVPRQKLPSGSLDLLGMLNHLVKINRIDAGSTVGQVDFGVEVVSTGGAPATYKFTDFSITDGR